MKKKFRSLTRVNANVINKAVDLSNELQKLSIIASEIYGEELIANLCNGFEIEFRTMDDTDGLNSISLRLEDIIKKAQRNLEGDID